MTEPIVPVPVSLIERAAELLDKRYPGVTSARLRALLSQPTPTAEPCPECRYVEGPGDDCGRLDDYLAHRDDDAPPSIADMVPGTTFRARMIGGTWEPLEWKVTPYGALAVRMWTPGFSGRIDPSTIRDVTPPKEHP